MNSLTRREMLIGMAALAGGVMVPPRIGPASATDANTCSTASDSLPSDPSAVEIDAPVDGSDATSTILRQLEQAPDGSTVVFPIGGSLGRYRVDGTLLLENRRGLTISGPPGDPAIFWTPVNGLEAGVLSHVGTSARRHWFLQDCEDVTLRHLQVIGPLLERRANGHAHYRPIMEAEHAFDIGRCNNVTIEDCVVQTVHGDGCHVGGGTTPSTGVVIRNVSVDAAGRHACTITNASDVEVSGLHASQVGYSGIDLEPAGGHHHVDGVQIRGCSFDVQIIGVSARSARAVSNVVVADNTFRDGTITLPQILVRRLDGGFSENWTITGNRQEQLGRSRRALSFDSVRNITVENNVMRLADLTKNVAGVRFVGCDEPAVVRGNDFGAAQNAVIVEEGTLAFQESDNIVGSLV